MRLPHLPVSYSFSLAALLVEAIILFFVIYFGVHTLNERMGAQAQKNALRLKSMLTQSLAEPLVRKDYSQLTNIIRSNIISGAIDFAIIYNSKGNPTVREGAVPHLAQSDLSHTNVMEAIDQGSPYFVTRAPIRLGDVQYGTLRFGIPIQHLYEARIALVTRYLQVGLAVLLFSIGTFVLIGRLFRNKLINIARQIEKGHLYERQDEFADLTRTFNTLITKELDTQTRLREHKELLEETVKERTQELARLASVDSLTNIANRRTLDDFLEKEWQRRARSGGWLSLIMLDVDHFKQYNDHYGHQAGDECLVAIAWVLKEVTRRPSDLVARYGGEEFTCVLSNTPLEGALSVANTIQTQIKELALPHEASLVDPHVTMSIGVASCLPKGKEGGAVLLAIADKCLYLAKREGRNCIRSRQLDFGTDLASGQLS